MLASRVSFHMISNPAIDSPRYLVCNVSWISILSWTTVAFRKCLHRDPCLMDLGYPTGETAFPPLGFALSNFSQALSSGAHLLGMCWIKPNHPFPFQRTCPLGPPRLIEWVYFTEGSRSFRWLVVFSQKCKAIFSPPRSVTNIYIYTCIYI